MKIPMPYPLPAIFDDRHAHARVASLVRKYFIKQTMCIVVLGLRPRPIIPHLEPKYPQYKRTQTPRECVFACIEHLALDVINNYFKDTSFA